MRWNREAFDRIGLAPRVLRGGPGGHTRLELFGRTFAHPILVAPVAYQRLAHADGEGGTAAAAAAQEGGLVLSTLASETLEQVAATAPPRRWLQLYVQPESAHTLDLVARAEAAGYEALVVTVDAPVNGARDRERRAGFRLPPGIVAANLTNYLAPAPAPGTRSMVFDHFMSAAPSWSDIDWLAARTRLPVVLKGILHADDAELAIAHGASGIVVSNHGGRTLDTLPPPSRCCQALPIASAAACRFSWTVASAAAPTCSRPCPRAAPIAGRAGDRHGADGVRQPRRYPPRAPHRPLGRGRQLRRKCRAIWAL